MRVVFSIDNAHEPRTLSRFLRHMDNQRAVGKLRGPFQVCIGKWGDKLENSFICNEKDFYDFAVDWTKGQEAILLIDSANFAFMGGFSVGNWNKVTAKKAMVKKGWTYIMEDNTWWIVE